MTRRRLCQIALAPVGLFAATAEFARRVFDRANELRIASGLAPLAWSEPLSQCATEQSIRKEKLRFPGHDDPERGPVAERLRSAGVAWERCGENLFSERGFDDPVHFAIVFWWYSPGHKSNMLSPDFTHSAVGVTQGADGTYFVTQIFVRPPVAVNPPGTPRPRFRAAGCTSPAVPNGSPIRS